jgi:hypothetical protein
MEATVNSIQTCDLQPPITIPGNPVTAASDEVLSRLKSLLIPYEQLEEVPAFLYVLDGEERYPIFSPGNLSAIIGKPKSKKTFLTLMAVAAALKGTTLFEKLEGAFPETHKKVVLFDTEQSIQHAQRSLRRICKLVGIEQPDNLFAFSLRRFSTAERLQHLKFVVETVENTGLIIIDGIKDLVQDINSTVEATEIIDYLMKLSAERSLHICVVLHQNKGDNYARGHLGSEVQNKCETVISVKKETDNSSTVNVEYCRDENFPSFSFAIDSDGLPYVTESVKKIQKGSVLDMDAAAMEDIVRDIFDGGHGFSYDALQKQVVAGFKKNGYSVGTSNAKKLITLFKEKVWISNVAKGGRSAEYRLVV